MNFKDQVENIIEEKRDSFINISNCIWDFAETRFEEFESSNLQAEFFEKNGFSVKKDLADMPTAFVAEYGSGKPVIGFLGEFDALDGLSQASGEFERRAVKDDMKGHGCGHHVLGTGSLAAAIAVKDIMEEKGLSGTVRYYGCPGEEGGSGKVYLSRAGLFNDVDAALSWHPGPENRIWSHNFLSTMSAYFKFEGISSHAGASPHLGRSALDAVELMNVGANFLREHIIQDARLHYAITDAGGLSPNVVQANASVLYLVRAPKQKQVKDIFDRVIDIAKGAALMTGTKVEVQFDRASANLLRNYTLEKLIYKNFEALGPTPINENDIEIARKYRETFSEGVRSSTDDLLQLLYGNDAKAINKKLQDKEILDELLPYNEKDTLISGSTDTGDVSWHAPLGMSWITCFAKDTPAHSWQEVAQGKTDLCHKGMLHAGKVLAMSGLDLLTNPELLKDVRNDFEEGLKSESYISLIPADVKPAARR
ncbi:MAG: M20 family metallopeptidase [Spirochaetales bacterium]|nr:M20 family metallopeptidase [Spirochaetales bacterium]